MPASLLSTMSKELPFGTFMLRRLFKAVHILPGRTLEFRVRGSQEPELERINVRRVLSEKLDDLRVNLTASREKEAVAIREKRASADSLLPGQLGPRNKALKLATVAARGARDACQALLDDLPERETGEETALQFDWLPTMLNAARKEVNTDIAGPQAELLRLKPSIDAREAAKTKLSFASETMHALSMVELPLANPPLENAGKLSMDSLQGSFYHHRELLYSRRALACSVSRYAATLAAEMSNLETQTPSLPTLLSVDTSTLGTPVTSYGRGTSSPMHNKPGSMKGGSMGGGSIKGGSMKGGSMGGGSMKGGGGKKPVDSRGPYLAPGAKGGPKVLELGGPLQRVKALMLLTPSPELQAVPAPVPISEKALPSTALDPRATVVASNAASDSAAETSSRASQTFHIITPERVMEMCKTLGIDIESSEPEFYLLWIAVEAIALPLPPLWRRIERPAAQQSTKPIDKPAAVYGGFGSKPRPDVVAEEKPKMDDIIPTRPPNGGIDEWYYYEHSVTSVISAQHPLLPVFKQVVVLERRRRDRPRSWSSVESWMLFAGEGDATTTYFYNFASRQRSRELPGELIAEKLDKDRHAANTKEARAADQQKKAAQLSGANATPKRSHAESAQLRKDVALGRKVTKAGYKGIPGHKPPKSNEETVVESGAPHAAARAATKNKAAEMTNSTKLWRHISLQLRPRSLPELLVAAGRFDVDIFAQPSMLWLCDAVLACDHYPVAWTKMPRNSWSAVHHSTTAEGARTTSKLTSTERLRFFAYGEIPQYFNALLRVASEQNPMVAVVKDAERSLNDPLGGGKEGGQTRMKAEAYR